MSSFDVESVPILITSIENKHSYYLSLLLISVHFGATKPNCTNQILMVISPALIYDQKAAIFQAEGLKSRVGSPAARDTIISIVGALLDQKLHENKHQPKCLFSTTEHT